MKTKRFYPLVRGLNFIDTALRAAERVLRRSGVKNVLPKSMVSLKKRFNGPGTACIGIANPCNFNCIFCPAHFKQQSITAPVLEKEDQPLNAYLSLNSYKNLIRELHILRTNKVLFQGLGEPLLHRDILEMLEMAKSKKMRVGITTNGSLLTKEHARAITDLSVDSLGISLNSATPDIYKKMHGITGSDSLEKISEMLRLLNDYKKKKDVNYPRVIISAVICKWNYSDIRNIIDFAIKVNAQQVNFYRFYFCAGMKGEFKDIILGEEDYTIMEKELVFANYIATKNCIQTNISQYLRIYKQELSAPSSSYKAKFHHISRCGILADGVVYPVEFPEIMGNIKERSIIDIWYSQKYLNFRKKILRLADEGGSLPTNIFCRHCDPSPSYSNDCRFLFVEGSGDNLAVKVPDNDCTH